MKKLLLASFSFIGFASLTSQIDTLKTDPLLLNEVVISDYSNRKNVNSASSITALKSPADLSIQGVAHTIGSIPGMYVDASAGEVFSRVYTRGISLSAEDDIGWYYTSLQEDGLPISMVQYQQFSPDFFLRPDISHQKMEVVRGGKSSVLTSNSPGGIVNFISNSPTSLYQIKNRFTYGMYSRGRQYVRFEGYNNGPLGTSSWAYNLSYMYRYDQGPRELDHTFNDGGQVKLGITKTLSNGIITARIKWLDDKVNRYTGVPATNWSDPQPAFDMNFQNNSLLTPGWADKDYQIGGLYNFNPRNGIRAKEIAAQLNIDLDFNGWRLTNKGKFSKKHLDWQTTIGGQPLGLDNFLTYFISGDAFPAGLISFKDVSSGEVIAQVNNEGAFAVFQGLPPSFEYTSGSLPNDAIMASGAWKKDDSIDEWMNEFRIQKDFSNIDFTSGLFLSSSEVNVFTNASFIYSTYEPISRLLQVTVDNPGQPSRALSDPFGVSNYGALFREAASLNVFQSALFSDALIHLTNRLDLNLGFRYENISHKGTKDRSGPIGRDGGIDGNPLTSYDNGPQQKINEDNIDFDYNFLSYSIGANYQISDQASLFGRYSKGNKAPELNYYMDNFANQEVNKKADIQTVTQVEMGVKLATNHTSMAMTAFYSQLENVPYSNFVFDDDTKTLFYTPTQLNSASAKGLEFNLIQQLSSTFSISVSGTIQDARLDQFSLYNANQTTDISDDITVSYNENKTPHNPDLMFRIGAAYNDNNWYGSVRYNYTGSRFGNNANGFKLPAYGTIDLGIGYAISERFSTGIRVSNLTNSAGLQNFFGPNTFGANSDIATTDYIQSNPNQSFVVFPIMPRAVYITFEFALSK